ncbi:hypothetical protein QE449_003053 [Rhodococcus sp. SORGH_AS303]|nr:hypothetical protein [Rhodococcus sp. SORGH_AS_0303]
MDIDTVVWTESGPRQEWWEAVMAQCGTATARPVPLDSAPSRRERPGHADTPTRRAG